MILSLEIITCVIWTKECSDSFHGLDEYSYCTVLTHVCDLVCWSILRVRMSMTMFEDCLAGYQRS